MIRHHAEHQEIHGTERANQGEQHDTPLQKGSNMIETATPIAHQEIWEKARQGDSQEARRELVNIYARIVKYVAGRMAIGLPHYVEFNDLISAGLLGLIQAIDHFDHERGIKFETYAIPRIRGSILDELRSQDWFPRSLRRKAKQLEEAYATLADTLIMEESDIVWMPDGNASLTRQMVRRLIPAVAPGDTIEDLVTARFDYNKLDLPNHPVRLRLNSSAVNASNNPDGSVSVAYVTKGTAYRVKAKHCVMACYNGLIPHLCPDMPEEQKENLRYSVKVPLLATNVLIRNRQAFNKAGVEVFHCPTSHYHLVSSAPPVSIGDYKANDDTDSPMLIYMLTSPTDRNNGSQTGRDLYRQARHKLYTTTFADYEQEIREQLTGMFGAFGFDAERDIEAITINRWSHGYAYDYMELYDPQWPEGEAPHELGRKRFGRISIANSDSENKAYLDAAIDAAWRAVNEQLDIG